MPDLQAPPPPIITPRLTLVPSTAPLAQAAIRDRQAFSALLGAHITHEWPPEVLADVEAFFAGKLAESPHLAGWFGWYGIATDRSLVDQDTLVASVGSMPPDNSGIAMFGYSVLPAFERRGIGTEAATAFVSWLRAQPGVQRLRADCFEGNVASIRIIQRCGLHTIGVSPDDATAPDSDRKGRGTLLRLEG